MDFEQVRFGLIIFFHDFFTVVWVGGLAMMVLTLLPTVRKAIGKTPQAQEFMMAILKRHSVWVYVSIVGLFISGMLMAKAEPSYTGFMHFDTLYAQITSIKHILIFMMVFIAFFRSIVFGKKQATPDPKKNKISMLLIVINFILGILVLLLSGFVTAL
jgi:uncharacterized membrane protein